MLIPLLGLISALFSGESPLPKVHSEPESFDLVAYGATPAGIAATIQAKRMGKSAILLEPTSHVGGLTSSGLGYTDTGDKAVIGGISREFYRLVKKHYDSPGAWVHEERSRFSGYREKEDTMWVFEPKVAEAILEKMLNEAGVKLITGARLDRRPGKGILKQGNRILSLQTQTGEIYQGKIFIDASYEGDLMAQAGVSSAIGRESNTLYGETLNGFQPYKNLHNHRFIKEVDPYVKSGDSKSGLLFGIEQGPYPSEGDGDHRVQAYCFRMCMTRVAVNRKDFEKPADYREDHYELLFRNLEAGDLRFPMHPAMLPNGKTDTNNNGAISTDFIGFSNDFPTAGDERRLEILRQHESWQKGLMWTLKYHPRTPKAMRDLMKDWGLAKDEFRATGNWPHQIYVREARRMVGAHVMTEMECRGIKPVPGPVGMGSYNMDSHNCTRIVKPNGKVENEGDIQVSPGGPYSISYLSLCPQKAQCTNLLVPVCLSCSHMAYGSIRMEPVFFVLGQSAGTAACMAMDENIPVQDIKYEKLRARLMADGQVLEKSRPPRGPGRGNLIPEKMEGIVVDDTQAIKTGIWFESSSIAGFVGQGYLHDGDQQKGTKLIRFETKIQKPGNYEVRFYYTASGNRTKKANIIVEHEGKTTPIFINQTTISQGGFQSLGVFPFTEKGAVTISNEETKGHVVVDAVQWIQSKK